MSRKELLEEIASASDPDAAATAIFHANNGFIPATAGLSALEDLTGGGQLDPRPARLG